MWSVGIEPTLKAMWNTFSACLSRSAENATEAISLALHSVSHRLKVECCLERWSPSTKRPPSRNRLGPSKIYNQLITPLLKTCWIISQISAPHLLKFTQNFMHIRCSFKFSIVKIKMHLCICLIWNSYLMLYYHSNFYVWTSKLK